MEEVRLAKSSSGHVGRQGMAAFLIPTREQRVPVHERQKKRREEHLGKADGIRHFFIRQVLASILNSSPFRHPAQEG